MLGPARSRGSAVLVAIVIGLAGCAAPSPSGTPSAAIPTEQPRASASESPGAGVTPLETPAVTIYTVLAGDTLFSIATRFGTSVAQLQAWNAEAYPSLATDPGSIETGWQLVVADRPDVTPLPRPTPTAGPTTGVATCHAGNRAASSPSAVYRRIPGAGAEVALTFDMGGRLDPALQILDLLIASHVCATLFPTGAMTQTTEGVRVMAIVRAHPELFEVGNHTMHHCDLVSGGGGSPTAKPCAAPWSPTAANIGRELTDAAAIIRSASGQSPIPYWRPPYGSYDQAVLNAAAAVGYTKTMLWDIDTVDWKPISDGGPTAAQISTKVVSGAAGGSVVLMHLGGYETLAALKTMIPGLRHRGFLLTSISDLLDGR